MKNPNTIIIGDRHLPFTKQGYLDFCVDTYKRYGCREVIDIGDGVDHHAISYHEKDPSGYSAGCEYRQAKKALGPWFKAFPNGKWCIGNHDSLIARKAYTAGIPSQFLKTLAEIYEAPSGWEFGFEFVIGTWRAIHGTKLSGHSAAFKAANAARRSTVCGHVHTAAGVRYHAAAKDIIWGMNVGCGINHKAYCYAYGKDFVDKPILGCGVVLENGTLPMFVPMPM